MLRVRTGYSFRYAAGSLDEVMSRLKEVGAEYAPITDRASTFGFHRWAKLAEKNGLRPVFGVELAVTPSINAKKPIADHWTFIARDSTAPLNRLVERATMQFRYQPLLTYDQAINADGVNRMTGHRPQLDWAAGPSMSTHVPLGPSSAKGLINMAIKHGWPLAATSDNRYTRHEDAQFQEVLCGGGGMQTYEQHIQTPAEWRKSIAHLDLDAGTINAALSRSSSMLGACTAKLQKATLPTPEKPATLRVMCEAGAKRIGCDLNRPEYAERLTRELDLIAAKNFDDYFYIVADVVAWAREHMIVGPARGSSCGSLVCYLLGITTIDPIPHGLIFERFVDIEREDLPDIDTDFSDQRRGLVFDYIIRKYGREHVARLGTVAMFQPRSALQSVGTALKIPRWECDAVAESLVATDTKASTVLAETFATTPAGQRFIKNAPAAAVACRLEGHPRHYSRHAAGIVLAGRPITDYVAVDHRTGATMCDKKDAEAGFGLLKFDALGLTQLSVFEDALEMAGLPRDHLETIPLDDPAAFDVLNKAQWAGIFQFNGQALQSITKQFKVDSLHDIISVTAVARPGPMASGGAQEWALRRNGTHAVAHRHPIFEPYLKDTLGIVLFQEQVMQIAREIGELNWGQVTALRKAMSKSLGAEYFNQFGDPWKEAAIQKGVRPDIADLFWSDLCKMGAWAFNRSHSVAYGIVSYRCCWLKAHYPSEFAAATLSHENDPDRQIQLLREIAAEGCDYIPVDPDFSTDKWSVAPRGANGQRSLVGPLSSVKGIGPRMMNAILSSRVRNEPLPERARKLLENAKTDIDSLSPIADAYKRLVPDPLAISIVSTPTPIDKIQIRQDGYDMLVICTISRVNPKDDNAPERIAKRGYKIGSGPTASLNLQLRDDTDTIFAKVDRWKYDDLGKPIVDRGRIGKALYAIKGAMRGGGTFRGIDVKAVKYLGDMDESHQEIEAGAAQ